jgi:CheY-like chemotaxis protein
MASPDTLLLADDSVTMQRVVELTLAEQGVKVVSVSDGQHAIDYITSHRPSLALISVTLPKVSGFDVARHVRDHVQAQRTPVLLLAGAFDTIDDAQVRESGAAGVLVKPFEPAVVIKRVKELLGMSKADSERPASHSSSDAGRLVTSADPPSAHAASSPEARTSSSTAPSTAPPPSGGAGARALTDERLRSAFGEPTAVASPAAASDAVETSSDYLRQLDAAFDSLDAQLAGRSAPDARPTVAAAPPPPVAARHESAPPPAPTDAPVNAGSNLSSEYGVSEAPPRAAAPEAKPVFEVDDNWFRQASAAPQSKGLNDFVVTRASDYTAPSALPDDRSWAPRGEQAPDTSAARDELTSAFDQLAAALTPAPGTPLNAPGVPNEPAVPGAPVAPIAPHSSGTASSAAASIVPTAPIASSAAVPADAFAMLWAHEQGEPMPAAAPVPLELSETSVNAVAAELSTGLADRVVGGLVDRLIGGIADRVGTPLAERLGDSLTDRLTAGLADRLAGGVADRLSAHLPAPIAAGVSERVATGVGERISTHLGERVTETVSQQLTAGVSDRVVAGLANPLATIVSERVTAGVADRVGAGLADQVANSLSERVVAGVSERLAPIVAERITPVVADRVVTALGERVSTGLAERVAERVAERMMQSAFGDAMRQTVNEVAERLVRAEIERIRAAASSLRAQDSPS